MKSEVELTSAEEKIRDAQRLYNRDYYRRNRKRILERNKKWRQDNPEKVKEANHNYWQRRAEELNL